MVLLETSTYSSQDLEAAETRLEKAYPIECMPSEKNVKRKFILIVLTKRVQKERRKKKFKRFLVKD